MSGDKINKFFTKLLSSNWDEIKFLLDNTALLSMSDTGGQPEFMDMQPALVIGPALYLIFCKLTQDLQSHYSISYLSTGESSVPVKSAYTVEENIFQAISAVACLGLESPEKQSIPLKSGISSPIPGGVSTGTTASENVASENMTTSLLAPSKSKAIIIGTHSDLVNEEDIEKFDADLQQRIRATDFFKEDLIQFASKNRLVLAVNNKSGGADKVYKFIEELIKRHFKY